MSDFVIAVDANNLLHVDWHGTKSAAKAELLFHRRLSAFQSQFNPRRLVVAFDDAPTFRHVLYPKYKDGREEKLPELARLIKTTHEAMASESDIPAIRATGFEADDILSTIAADCAANTTRCVLVTADKDANQCLRDGLVSIAKKVSFQGGKLLAKCFTASDLLHQVGVGPRQFVDYQMLVGDREDNLPGVPGIGPETAKMLLGKFRSLDEVPETCWSVKPAQREALKAAQHRFALMRKLFTLRTNVPHVLDAL